MLEPVELVVLLIAIRSLSWLANPLHNRILRFVHRRAYPNLKFPDGATTAERAVLALGALADNFAQAFNGEPVARDLRSWRRINSVLSDKALSNQWVTFGIYGLYISAMPWNWGIAGFLSFVALAGAQAWLARLWDIINSPKVLAPVEIEMSEHG